MTAVAIVLVLFAALPACGRKNPPVLPDGQTDEFERQYPTSTEPQQGIFD
jgi:predicted small lipoprotein YifL